jgi:hypothetical protein
MKKILILATILAILPFDVMSYSGKATVFNPETGHRKSVNIGDKNAFDGGYLLETSYGYMPTVDGEFGYGVISNYKTTLSRSINSSASTVYVSSMTTNDGHTITMSDLGSKVFLTIDPGKTKEEIIMCTGISSLSFTGCTRGLAFYGTSTAAVSANQESHNSGATIVMSNVHYVYEELIDNDTNQTISGNISIYGNLTATGTINFSSGSSVSVPAPTADSHAATKLYADNLAFTGFGTSTLTTAGGGYLSTKAEMSAGSYNSNQPKFLYSGLATSTGQVATSSIVVTEADGDINSNMIGQDQNYSWSGTNSNSGTNTFTGQTNLASTTITGQTYLASTSISSYPTASTSVSSKGYVDTKADIYTNSTGTTTKYAANWVDVDVSATVGAKSTFLIMSVCTSAAADYGCVRANGDGNNYFVTNGLTPGAGNGSCYYTGATNAGCGIVYTMTDSSGIIEVKSGDTDWVYFTILGYIN